jgi:ribosomal protein S27E
VARKLKVEKLSDEAGVYRLAIKCGACGHERVTEPHTLGKLCGWNAKLDDVAERMRCSKCGKKQCTLRAEAPPRRS